MIPGTFFDAVERLLNVAPPPKTAKDRADLANARKTLRQVEARAVRRTQTEARANERALLARIKGKKRSRKKAR